MTELLRETILHFSIFLDMQKKQDLKLGVELQLTSIADVQTFSNLKKNTCNLDEIEF